MDEKIKYIKIILQSNPDFFRVEIQIKKYNSAICYLKKEKERESGPFLLAKKYF